MTTSTRLRRLASLLTLLALLALVGSGCSGAGSGESESGGSTAEGDAGEAARDAPAAAPAPAAAEGAAEEGADADAGGASRADNAALVRERSVISTGTVILRENDLEATLLDVRQVIDAHRGEIAERESDTDDEGEMFTARLVVRVPSGEFAALMDELSALSERASTTQSSEDVTTQVIDVEARVRAQTASLERVEALLARAEDLRDIVAIESQLTRRQADLDSLRSQQAWLADQTSLSTVTVYLEQRGDAEPAEDDSGFLAGLAAGWRGLGRAFVASATVLGAVLPFAVVLAVVGYPTLLLARRLVRRRGGAIAAPAPAPATPAQDS